MRHNYVASHNDRNLSPSSLESVAFKSGICRLQVWNLSHNGGCNSTTMRLTECLKLLKILKILK